MVLFWKGSPFKSYCTWVWAACPFRLTVQSVKRRGLRWDLSMCSVTIKTTHCTFKSNRNCYTLCDIGKHWIIVHWINIISYRVGTCDLRHSFRLGESPLWPLSSLSSVTSQYPVFSLKVDEISSIWGKGNMRASSHFGADRKTAVIGAAAAVNRKVPIITR